MPELHLRAMTETEFENWRLLIGRAYADDQIRSGNWAPEEAMDLALAGNAELLPQGLATEDMLLLTAEQPDGTAVGRVWLGLNHPRGKPGCAFLYDIEVEEPYRGQGYGRALLAAAEDVARSRGVASLELNVFGDNTSAIALYRSAGYIVVQQLMRTTLT